MKEPLPELHAFPDSLVFARRLAGELGRPVERIALHHFPDWESLVRVRATPRTPIANIGACSIKYVSRARRMRASSPARSARAARR